MKVFKSIGVSIIFTFIFYSTSFSEIKVYSGLGMEPTQKILSLIKEKTGVKVESAHLSFEQIESKLKAETPNFTSDMIFGTGGSTTILAKRNDWIIPYLSPSWKGVSNKYFDPEGYYYNFANWSIVIIGSNVLLKKFNYDMPTSWNDLLDQKWKDQILVASPLTSGTGNLIRNTILTIFGDTNGWNYFEKLNKNVNHYTRSGNMPVDIVARGEFMIGVTADELIKKRLEEGVPISWASPKEGSGHEGYYSFIQKGTKNFEECKKVIDFLGTDAASRFLESFGAYIPPRPLNNSLYGKNFPKTVNIDIVKSVEDKAKNNEIWKQKFR